MEMQAYLSNILVLLLSIVSFKIVVSKPVYVTQMVVDNVRITNETYQKQRQELLISESLKRLGGEIVLTPAEQTVNQILLAAKKTEVEDSLIRGKMFPPSENFLLSKPYIDASRVFQMLTKMPKGMSASKLFVRLLIIHLQRLMFKLENHRFNRHVLKHTLAFISLFLAKWNANYLGGSSWYWSATNVTEALLNKSILYMMSDDIVTEFSLSYYLLA